MADQGRSAFNVVFTMSLCALELKQLLISLLSANYMALISGVYAPRSYLKLICDYKLNRLPDKKVSGANDHSENYINVKPPLVHHLLHNRLLESFWDTLYSINKLTCHSCSAFELLI